jgi:hypothetical protein
MPTTEAAIRAAMTAYIVGITPEMESRLRFVPYDEGGVFREWAERNKAACTRRVSVRFTGTVEPPAVHDNRTQEVRTVIEIVIAYPAGLKFGRNGNLDLDDVIRNDATLVDAYAGSVGYRSVSAPATVIWEQANEKEDGTGCVFSVIRYRVDYVRSIPS